MVLNVTLFVPFGYSLARRRGRVFVVLAAAGVSAGAEATQLFSTLRYPSATDLTAAVIGAAIGAAWRRVPEKWH
jgi:glycopeptide antibiotics resistance protein